MVERVVESVESPPLYRLVVPWGQDPPSPGWEYGIGPGEGTKGKSRPSGRRGDADIRLERAARRERWWCIVTVEFGG